MPKHKLHSDPEVVEMPKVKRDWDAHLPVKGRVIIPEQFYNLVAFGTTGSGKTVLIHHLIRHTIDKRTTVHIFSDTYTVDPVWVTIVEYLRKHHIPYVHHQTIGQGGSKLWKVMDNIKEDVIEKRRIMNSRKKAAQKQKVYIRGEYGVCVVDNIEDAQIEAEVRRNYGLKIAFRSSY